MDEDLIACPRAAGAPPALTTSSASPVIGRYMEWMTSRPTAPTVCRTFWICRSLSVWISRAKASMLATVSIATAIVENSGTVPEPARSVHMIADSA